MHDDLDLADSAGHTMIDIDAGRAADRSVDEHAGSVDAQEASDT